MSVEGRRRAARRLQLRNRIAKLLVLATGATAALLLALIVTGWPYSS